MRGTRTRFVKLPSPARTVSSGGSWSATWSVAR